MSGMRFLPVGGDFTRCIHGVSLDEHCASCSLTTPSDADAQRQKACTIADGLALEAEQLAKQAQNEMQGASPQTVAIFNTRAIVSALLAIRQELRIARM